MREFVYGSDTQFNDLKRSLQDGRCHVYNNCKMPPCCGGKCCRIGFEMGNGVYTLLIDYGITCSKFSNTLTMIQFKQWLSDGELKFLDFNDLKVFLKSLSFLY